VVYQAAIKTFMVSSHRLILKVTEVIEIENPRSRNRIGPRPQARNKVKMVSILPDPQSYAQILWTVAMSLNIAETYSPYQEGLTDINFTDVL
jgi:hypothetical protein